MKSWLFVGAKVVCIKTERRPCLKGEAGLAKNSIWTVEGIIAPPVCSNVAIYLEGHSHGVDALGRRVPYDVTYFKPVSTIDTTKTVEALKQMMRDHVANASGGMGIKKPVRA